VPSSPSFSAEDCAARKSRRSRSATANSTASVGASVTSSTSMSACEGSRRTHRQGGDRHLGFRCWRDKWTHLPASEGPTIANFVQAHFAIRDRKAVLGVMHRPRRAPRRGHDQDDKRTRTSCARARPLILLPPDRHPSRASCTATHHRAAYGPGYESVHITRLGGAESGHLSSIVSGEREKNVQGRVRPDQIV